MRSIMMTVLTFVFHVVRDREIHCIINQDVCIYLSNISKNLIHSYLISHKTLSHNMLTVLTKEEQHN